MADELSTSKETPHEMGLRIGRMVEEGKGQVPHEPEPLVCKPRELEPWRVFKIMSEFVEGFELLQKYALAVTFFGSTRTTPDNPWYKAATDLAAKLAQRGFAVITGGSSGIMEAANKGAFEVGGASVGLNISLDVNQATNKYVTEEHTFHHFFVRKVMLTFASEVYIYFPGGFGTLDEFFEILTLVQTKKIKKIPIILYGKEYWEDFVKEFQTKLYGEYKSIDAADMELYVVVDSVEEAYDYIIKNVQC
jgi:uncharacterized protein (TIGR00730 family)